jgi:hypothetical protein
MSGYHPQANGQTEWANQEVEKYLQLYIDYCQDDWAEHLPMAKFAINSRTHSAIGMSLFKLMYGYLPLFNIPVGRRTRIPKVEEQLDILQEVRHDAGSALHLAKRQMKEGYEHGKRKGHSFKVGDYVWLSGEDIDLKLPSNKLSDRQLGPFKIIEKIEPLDYCLDLGEAQDRLYNVFHVDKLYPYRGSEVNGLLPEEPGPIELEDEDEPEYKVDRLLDSWIRWRRMEYKVKWKGYDPSHDSWQPIANLKNAKRSITNFHKKHPNVPRI